MSDDATTGPGMGGGPEPGRQDHGQPQFGVGAGGWQPLGEYDSEATMHVSFTGPFPDPIAVSHGADPLAAPGQGYAPVPPDQGGAAPGSWWQPSEAPAHPDVPHGSAPFEGTAWQQPAAAEDADNHWSVPFVSDDQAEESGEYSVGQMIAPYPQAAEAPADPPGPEQEAAGADGEAPDAAARPEPVPGEFPEPGEPAAEPQEFPEPDAGLPEPSSDHPTVSYVLRVNGSDRPVTDAWLGESLLYVLRERLGLAGAKDGCEQGECGACSVQVDGRLIASCLLPAATAAGCEVRTVEGLSQDGGASDVQRALASSGAVQCGFCVPGMAMTVHDLLEGNHRPTDLQIRQAICGNLCRCSGYQGVLDAVREVVEGRAAAAEEAAAAEGQPAAEGAWIPHQSSGPSDGGAAV